MLVNIKPEQAIIVTGNDGGYKSGYCLICGASGWLEGNLGHHYKDKNNPGADLQHKKDCPVNQEIKRKGKQVKS